MVAPSLFVNESLPVDDVGSDLGVLTSGSVKRDFEAKRIDQKWCGDLTEILTDEGKLYLATVKDLASRRLPGFAIGEHHDAALAKAALYMAAVVRGGNVAGVIFHSDIHRRRVHWRHL